MFASFRVFGGSKILRFKILILRLRWSHDTNSTRLRAKATARQASPHELTQAIGSIVKRFVTIRVIRVSKVQLSRNSRELRPEFPGLGSE